MTLRALNLLALVSIVALLGFTLVARGRMVDLRASERYEHELRSLLALDYRLTAEVMKARAGLVAHYDGIVQTEAARKRAHRALRELPRGVSDSSEFDRSIREGERARAETERLVERFKREQAVLHNSLHFLPRLARELAGRSGISADLASTIGTLVLDELALQSWQEGALLARIDAALAALSTAATRADAPLRSTLESLATHVRVVREGTMVARALTRKLAASEDAQRTQAMMATFHRLRTAALRIADRDASVRFVLSMVALAACAASIIARLRQAATSLQRSGEELSRALQSLRLEQEKQKELSELKSRFVAMASHEFRTPLSVIMSSNELLEAYGERWTHAKRHEHFTRIHQAAAGMTRMLEGILMIGRRDAGLLRFQPQSVDVDRFCGQVVESVATATGEAGRVVYRGLDRVEHVVADPTLLRHVLENLLSNALKYSPEDSSVELSVARDPGELRFDVLDHGIGMSAEDQRHLFETFYRGTNVGKVSGTGLGLAIVRGAVELHGGSISVESKLDAGTQFTVRIPCVEISPWTASS